MCSRSGEIQYYAFSTASGVFVNLGVDEMYYAIIGSLYNLHNNMICQNTPQNVCNRNKQFKTHCHSTYYICSIKNMKKQMLLKMKFCSDGPEKALFCPKKQNNITKRLVHTKANYTQSLQIELRSFHLRMEREEATLPVFTFSETHF